MDYIIRLIILAYGIYSLIQSGSQEMLEMIISIYPIVSDNMFINIIYILFHLTYGYPIIWTYVKWPYIQCQFTKKWQYVDDDFWTVMVMITDYSYDYLWINMAMNVMII